MNVTINKCQRCGNVHELLTFSSLDNPTDNFKYFALCPINNQPILMAIKPSILDINRFLEKDIEDFNNGRK